MPQAFPDQPPPNSVFVSDNPPPYPGVMGVTYPPGPGASGMPSATGAASAPPGYPSYPGNQAGFSHNPAPPPGYPGGFAAPGASANNMSPRGMSIKILKLEKRVHITFLHTEIQCFLNYILIRFLF